MRAEMKRLRAIVRWHVEIHVLRMLLRPKSTGKLTKYQNWIVPDDVLDSSSTCYCAGVGEDLNFELMLVRQFSANVYAFDPTPRAIMYADKVTSGVERFRFFPVGLWSSDTTLRFYAPENPAHVSHSIVDSAADRPYFDAQCKKVSTLMRELGHEKIDLLKMNIEGAEYEVLNSLLTEKLRPGAICLTFEGRSALLDATRWTRKLRQYGYELAGLHKWAATFVRTSAATR